MIKRPVPRRLPGFCLGVGMLMLVLLVSLGWCSAQDSTNAVPDLQVQPTNTPNAELLQTLRRIQDQLRASTLAIEQNGKELREGGVHTAEALSSGLQSIENVYTARQDAFFAQASRELEAIRGTNRLALVIACAVAGMAVLSMMFMAYHQWRLSKIGVGILTLPAAAGNGHPALLEAGPGLIAPDAVQESNHLLLDGMERLQRRIQALEHSFRSPVKAQPLRSCSMINGQLSGVSNGGRPTVDERDTPKPSDSQAAALLAQGQALLNTEQFEAAVAVFDEILSTDPNHGEALVKKGAALERLKKLSEASACYDQAIAADTSMTIAYLHKAGLYSRMQRFQEALECYEKALQTNDEWHS